MRACRESLVTRQSGHLCHLETVVLVFAKGPSVPQTLTLDQRACKERCVWWGRSPFLEALGVKFSARRV